MNNDSINESISIPFNLILEEFAKLNKRFDELEVIQPGKYLIKGSNKNKKETKRERTQRLRTEAHLRMIK